MADIPITGIPSTFRTPGVYGEILFNQGPSNAGIGARQVVMCMPMSAAGTWTANELYRVRNEAVAREGAGVGSPLYRALRRFLRNNKDGEVYALPYAQTSGTSDVAATGTVTWTTDPTARGKAYLVVCGERLVYEFTEDDTVTTIAAAMVAQVNARDFLPCTANNSSGVLTLTARVDGISQGDGTVGVIRYRASIDPGKGTTVATSGAALGLGTGTDGAEGTTTEVANLTAALAALGDNRKYYIGFSAWSAAGIAAVSAHVAAKSLPKPGSRCIGVTAYTGTQSACQTLALGENYERIRIFNQPNSEFDVADLVGNALAVLQKWESRDATFNFNGYDGKSAIEGANPERDWEVPAVYSVGDWPDDDDASDAINNGVTLIRSRDGGSYISKTVSTRSKDQGGNVQDNRSLSSHVVSGADYYMDTLLARLSRFANKKLKDDQRLENGQVDANQQLAPKVVTPSTIAPTIRDHANDMEALGIIDSAATVANTLIAQIDPDNGGRVELGLDFRTIALLDQMTVRAAEVTPG